jgi:tetratricopeptide (TPR) repeat protein
MLLLERAKKAIEKMNYTELERIISEVKSIARDMNISVGSLAGDLFSKAKLVDLDKIDLVFSEAERKISAEMARARVIAMRDLMTSSRELGVYDEEFQSLLDKAEKALESKDYDVIEEYKEEFEERLEEAKIKHKTEFVGMGIMNAKNVISQFKEQGINVDNAEELLAQAEKEFNAQNFEKAKEIADQAEKIAEKMSQRHDTEQELGSVMEVISEAKATGVDVEEANGLLSQAENEISANNLVEARELIEKARGITSGNVRQFIQNKFPKLTVKLPEGGMEADVWNKCFIEVANIGNLIAKNVNVNFRGEIEVKGIDRIEKLDVGENMRMEIGVKPKKSGELDMDVSLAYQRAFDDTIYQLSLAKKIIADTRGTYAIEEVLLIHNSGVLISQASRRLEDDVDRDIFSSMFTAVQQFIKDSFRDRAEVGLKRMDFGQSKILIEHGHYTFLTAIIVGGEPRYLPLYMVEVLKEVEQKYGSVLDGWRGMYSELEGIDGIIGKLLQVTEEKGAEVEGFESGVVASTVKLIQAAEEAGVRTGGQEAFVEEFIQTMEKEGFENAWGYLEKMGKEVNVEISAETARETVSTMKELMNFAREWEVNEEEFISLLDMAEKACDTGEFDKIDGYKDTFETKLEEAKLKHKTDMILRRIKNAIVILTQFKELGINVEKLEELLALADNEFKAKDFLGAEKDVDQAEKLADGLRKGHDIRLELSSIKETLSEIKEMKFEIEGVNELLIQAENEVDANNFFKAKELMEKASTVISSNIKHLIQDKFPKLTLKLPEGGMEAGVWNKCIMEIANDGDLIAKNVDVTLQGDVEVKGIESVKKLAPGGVDRKEIGLKPMKGGELDVEVKLTYQRAFDDTIYQLDLGKKINVDDEGTYLIENIFLIHNTGILITQVSRKLEEDVDREIFSGMLTAIQEFVKDSFKRNLDVGLKRMDFGPNKILIEHGRFTFLTTVLIGGEPRLLPLYMLEVLNEVEQKYGTVLDKWDGTYSKLEGINDTIAKLMLVCDEKGVEVEGFESGAVASTIKLIESAKEDGVEIVAPESFAEEIGDIIEREGFENAWTYLEKIGKEVKKSSDEFRIKKEDIDELMHAYLGDMDEHLIRDIGDSLEHYLTIVDNIIKLILTTREELEIKATTPIKVVAIKSPDRSMRDALNKLKIPFLSKVNAKNLEIIEPDMEWEGLKLELIPKRDVITHAYKQQASKVETLLKYQSPWKIKGALEKAGEYTLGVEGYPVKITSKMLDFKLSIPDNVVAKEFDGGTIYLNKELTDEMKKEGIAEELIEHINGMRKELNINDEKYIETQVVVPDKIAELLESWKEHIASKTRSYALEFPFENIFESGESGYYVVDREIGGEKATIGIVVVEWEES